MWAYNQTPSSELYHFGILGMKWGVRRYQNKDGTLTSKGKKRYGGDSDEGALVKSKIKEMSDDDLRKAINRLQMEKQLAQLLSESGSKPVAAANPAQVSKGQKIAKQLLESSGKILAAKMAAKLGDYLGDKLTGKLKTKDDNKQQKAVEKAEKTAEKTAKAAEGKAVRREERAEKKADRLYKYYNPSTEKKENLHEVKWLI